MGGPQNEENTAQLYPLSRAKYLNFSRPLVLKKDELFSFFLPGYDTFVGYEGRFSTNRLAKPGLNRVN